MLRYQDIAENEPQLLALTSLTRAEFEHLVPYFATSFADALQGQTVEGFDRIGRAYTSYRNSPLPTMEDKLLFILVYVKQYPTQTVQGQLFGLSQSNANKWIHLLHPILNQALARAGHRPSRTATLNGPSQDAALATPTDGPSLFSTMVPNARSTAPATRMSKPSTIAASESATHSKISS